MTKKSKRPDNRLWLINLMLCSFSVLADYPYPIVDTGQNQCFDSSGIRINCANTAQDGAYLGHPPAYINNGDGTTTDSITGLIWQNTPDLNGDGQINASDKRSQADAESYCSTLNLAGYRDWRLPNIKTLYSLIDFNGGDASSYLGSETNSLTPFIDTEAFAFAYGDTAAGERIIDVQYASSTLYVGHTMVNDTAMFGVNFADGRIKGYPVNSDKKFNVQCVRGNELYGVNQWIDNNDSTVSDQNTRLMWQKSDSVAAFNWENAIAYCEASTTGNHQDWRLPNAKELQSLIDYNRSPDTTQSAAIDSLFNSTSIVNEKGETDWGYYWSSTTHKSDDETGENAVYLAFGGCFGYINNEYLDLLGAVAKRSNLKKATANLSSDYGTTMDSQGHPVIYHGPQGDIVRTENLVRCVRNDLTETPAESLRTPAANTTGARSQTEFSYQMQVNGTNTASRHFQHSDTLNISATLHLDEKDRSQPLEVLVLAYYRNQNFIKTPEGWTVLTDFSLEKLSPYTTIQTDSDYTVEIENSLNALPGEFVVYVGYRYPNDPNQVIYTQTPLLFSVENNFTSTFQAADGSEEPVVTRLGGAVINFGLTQSDAATAETIAEQIRNQFLDKNIASVARIEPTLCSRDWEIIHPGLACYDAQLFFPAVAQQNWELFDNELNLKTIAGQIESHLNLGNQITYAQLKGVTWSQEGLGTLFAIRNMLKPQIAPASIIAKNQTLSTATATVDTLVWAGSIKQTVKDTGYEKRILAPDYDGTTNSSGSWVMTSLGIGVQSGDVNCLFARFRNLITNEKVKRYSNGNSSCVIEQEVVLTSDSALATGVYIGPVETNNVKGVGLFYGNPNYEINPIYPDFLTDVSPDSLVYSGQTNGTYNPSTSQYTDTYPYVVIGVDVGATSDKIDKLTVHLGRLTALEPEDSATWNNVYTIGAIEQATNTALNTVFDLLVNGNDVVDPLSFNVYPDCASTIPKINFCDNLQAEGSYSSTDTWDDICKGTCDATYQTCKATQSTCSWAGCNLHCGSTRDSCYSGCTSVVSGSAKINVKNAQGLENTTFSNASIPYLVSGSTMAVNFDATIQSLYASVYWKLCQSGICFSDTTNLYPLGDSKTKLRATGTITAKSCDSMAYPALYLTINDIEVVDWVVWDINSFINSTLKVVQDSMDWLAENISDVFKTDIQSQYEKAFDSAITALQNGMNSALVNTPIISCSN